MDRVVSRAKQNSPRTVQPQRTETDEEQGDEGTGTKLSGVTVNMAEEGYITYRIFHLGAKNPIAVDFYCAQKHLYLSLLVYLGVYDGRSVTVAQAKRFCLQDYRDDSSSKEYGRLREGSNIRPDWVPTHLRLDRNGIYWAPDILQVYV